MAQVLPRLRGNLDFMPSPSPEHPGLFIRDPFRYSDAMLIVPPPLVEALQCLDGTHTDLDLRASLVRITGDLNVSEIQEHLIRALSQAGFLEDANSLRMQQERVRDFAALSLREPAHAGSAYPAALDELRQTMTRYMGGVDGHARAADQGKLFALAAPHVSPEGGWQSYQAAYRLLGPEYRDRTFVILATSHYGEPETFGLTRKSFVTPFGEAPADVELIDWLDERGGSAVRMEDYCHSFEHTVELQLIFLQQQLGPGVRILPILCSAFARGLMGGRSPEEDDGVRHFFDALNELHEREGDRLFWVLGVDMAHMGVRYQDQFPAVAGRGMMNEVAARDRRRIDSITAGDAGAFWDQVCENRDDLKWCGSSPFYTFLKAAPGARGELLHYEQWNIDAKSVVSFAGMAFSMG
ncbi:MAG: AmmeMemoRadiSam system protein B [Acidobacteriia bacterium]|nr:AmmeMemoRadiSam system protein B [Terriglobia bacterium]